MQVNFPITPSALLTFGLDIEHLWTCFELLKNIHAYIEFFKSLLLESMQLYTFKNI